MIINIENSIYPEKLKKLKNPPQILYTMGNIELLRTVSGMAEGIDSFVHTATLEIQGKTIAVLPCGFNNIFPHKNIKL